MRNRWSESTLHGRYRIEVATGWTFIAPQTTGFISFVLVPLVNS